MADRSVTVAMVAKFNSFRAGIRDASSDVKGFRSELGEMAKTNKAGMQSIENTAGLAGAAMLGLAGWVTKVGMEFDKQMSQVGAVTNASAGELDSLRQAALEAGKATVFSATEAAQAESELAKAGISTADIMGGALTGSLSLAAAGSLDLAEAADISAKAMNIWGLEGKDVTHIADVLAASANKSATDVHEMGEALRMGGMVAKQSGMSLEDTVGVLSAFADRALVGSDAGTSLKTMLMMLANPTDKASSLMEDLGIQVYDASGQFIGAERLAGTLQERLSGLTQQQRQSALATIFGSDATRAATVLYELGSKGVKDYVAAVDDAGAAARMASQMTDNLAGDVERLKGSLESLTIESGSGVSGGLRVIVQSLDHFVSTVSALPGPVKTAAVVLTAVGGAALLAAVGLLKVRRTVAEVIATMQAGGPAAQRFATGLQSTTKWAGRASAALMALMVVETVVDVLRDAAVDTESLAEALDHFAKSGEVSSEVLELFGEDLKGFGEAVHSTQGWGADFMRGAEGIPVIGDLFAEGERQASDFNRSAGDSVEVLKAVDDQLAAMVRNGNSQQALTIAQQLAKANNLAWEDVETALPQFRDALMNASDATKDQGNAAAGSADKNRDLAGGIDEAAQALKDWAAEWDTLHGKTMSADEALLAAKQAVDDLGKAFEESGGKLRGNSEAALANRIAMDEAARKATTAAQAYFDLTGDLKGAEKIMRDQKDAAEKAATANGGNAKQVHTLADELFKLPPSVTTKVNVPGLGAVERLRTALDGLRNKSITVTVDAHVNGNANKFVSIASAQRWGGVVQHAASGLLGQANLFAAGAKPLYAFAERETGGEAFVPRRGDYRRSMSILSQAANWYNASLVPKRMAMAMYGGQAAPAALDVDYARLGREVARAMRDAPLQVDAYMDGQLVGRQQARRTDLQRRGG